MKKYVDFKLYKYVISNSIKDQFHFALQPIQLDEPGKEYSEGGHCVQFDEPSTLLYLPAGQILQWAAFVNE